MKNILALIIAGSLLTGCAGIDKAKQFVSNAVDTVVSVDNVENIMLAYNATQNLGLAYGRSCKAKLLEQKTCWKIVNDLKPFEARATQAVLDLDDFSKSNPTVDATTFIQVAKRAINEWKNIQFIYGIK